MLEEATEWHLDATALLSSGPQQKSIACCTFTCRTGKQAASVPGEEEGEVTEEMLASLDF